MIYLSHLLGYQNCQSNNNVVEWLGKSKLGRFLGPCYRIMPSLFHGMFWFFSLLSLLASGISGCVGRKIAAAQSWSQNQVHRIAVLPFESSNPFISGTLLSDYLVVQILQEPIGLQVIERKDLMKILQEQKLTLTGVIRPEKFLKIGSILGVDAILVGSIQTLETIQSTNGSISVTVKLMEVATGRILWADRQTISHATWSVREIEEVSTALMEKAAKKIVRSLGKSAALQNFSSMDSGENSITITEANLRPSHVR